MDDRHANFLVHPDDVEAFGFDWGQLALTVGPGVNGAVGFSGGVVSLQPGQGHARHNHPEAEEIIFVVSGTGEQMVEDERGEPVRQPVHPGCTVYVPKARFHATRNTGGEPMRLFVVYTPAGPEDALREAPDFRLIPPGRDGSRSPA
jgi:oxalate decarboxylase/phosphoglucose isomerase-like protein (cupin superfamily)